MLTNSTHLCPRIIVMVKEDIFSENDRLLIITTETSYRLDWSKFRAKMTTSTSHRKFDKSLKFGLEPNIGLCEENSPKKNIFFCEPTWQRSWHCKTCLSPR